MHAAPSPPVQAAIMDVNAAVRQEAADVADVAGVLRALRSQYARFESVQDSNAPHYVTLLKAARAAKAEVKGRGAIGRGAIGRGAIGRGWYCDLINHWSN